MINHKYALPIVFDADGQFTIRHECNTSLDSSARKYALPIMFDAYFATTGVIHLSIHLQVPGMQVSGDVGFVSAARDYHGKDATSGCHYHFSLVLAQKVVIVCQCVTTDTWQACHW